MQQISLDIGGQGSSKHRHISVVPPFFSLCATFNQPTPVSQSTHKLFFDFFHLSLLFLQGGGHVSMMNLRLSLVPNLLATVLYSGENKRIA